MIKLTLEPEDLKYMGMEHCCFCAKRTAYWYEKKDVAICQPCGEIHVPKDVPSKEDWCRSPQSKGRLPLPKIWDDVRSLIPLTEETTRAIGRVVNVRKSKEDRKITIYEVRYPDVTPTFWFKQGELRVVKQPTHRPGDIREIHLTIEFE